MVSIKQKIQRPYFALIIAIPVAMFVLFNVLILAYSYVESKSNLEQAVAYLSETLDTQEAFAKSDSNLVLLMSGSHKVENTELLIFDKNGNRIFIQESESDFLTQEVIDNAYTETAAASGIVSFSVGLQSFHAVEIEVGSRAMMSKVIYLSAGQISSDFIRALNGILLLVSLVTICIFALISRKVSALVSKPISDIVDALGQFKPGELAILPKTESSVELHLLTQCINDLNRKVYDSHQAQASFMQNASHELRTPLMNIQGYADGIALGIFEDAKGTAHLISTQTKSLTALVDGLLTLARTEQTDTQTAFSQVNLHHFLSDCIQSYAGYANAQHIEIHYTNTQDAICMANEELLRNAVGNVISNALRYAKQSVIITLQQNNNSSIITIRDDGAGIQNEQCVFNRFYKGQQGNFGLGLSIAKIAMDKLGGSISAHNDGGAVFTLSVPKVT